MSFLRELLEGVLGRQQQGGQPSRQGPVPTRSYEDGSARVGQINVPARPRPYGLERRFEDGSMATQGGMRVPAFDSPNDFNRPGRSMDRMALQQGGYNPQTSLHGLRVQGEAFDPIDVSSQRTARAGVPLRGRSAALEPMNYDINSLRGKLRF